MPNISKKTAVISIVLFAIAAVLSVEQLLEWRRQQHARGSLARVKGEAEAPIQITEFIDFQCPACARGAQFLNEFMKKYPGKVRLELKYFPLNSHKHSLQASQYAECAGKQGKFWPYHDLLIDRQSQWKVLTDARPAFEMIARDANLNIDKLAACLQQETITEAIMENKEEGKTLGIRSTPTYFINGEMVVGTKSLGQSMSQLLDGGPSAETANAPAQK